tara:strand:- start:151 stop:669 length:519 start_codon:yes stop_codon:yes gene_type:complete
MTASKRALSDNSLFNLITRTDLDRQSFIALLRFYTIIFVSVAFCYFQKLYLVTDQPMLYGPFFVAALFFSERVYQCCRSFLATTTGFISIVLGFCTSALILAFGILLLQRSYPSADINLYVSIAAFGAMLVHACVARMRNLKASLGFMLSPLAILPIPYVLYVLAFKDTLAD